MPLERIVRRDLHRLKYGRAILNSAPVSLRTKFKNVSLVDFLLQRKQACLHPRATYAGRKEKSWRKQKELRARFPIPRYACVGVKKNHSICLKSRRNLGDTYSKPTRAAGCRKARDSKQAGNGCSSGPCLTRSRSWIQKPAEKRTKLYASASMHVCAGRRRKMSSGNEN